MAYKINNTFGTLLVTLADGTIDVATTDLTLIGKGYAGFGEKLNENLIKLLENFNNTSAPSNKIQGQLWYDKTNNQLNVYTGSKFKPVGSPAPSGTQPTNAVLGDEWFDTNNSQFYIYNGTSWTLIGPTTVAGSGVTQVVTETVEDNTGVNRGILKLVSEDSVVGVVSSLAFTPNSADTNGAALITAGFASVAQGIQLSSSVASVKFRGTATNADALGGVAAANYLRSDADDTTTGKLIVQSDVGLVIGAGQDVTMTLSSDDFILAQTTQDKDIIFTVNDGGVTKTPLQLTGADGGVDIVGDVTVTGNLTVSGEFDKSGSVINLVDDAFIKLNTGNSEADSGLIIETGDTDDARFFYDVSENHFTAGQGGTYSQVIRLADAVADGNAAKEKVLKTTAAGLLTVTNVSLAAVGSDITSSTSTSSTSVPTTGQVAKSLKLWGGSTISDDGSNSIAGNRYVETTAPTSGQGSNGDLWFVRQA